MKRSKCGGEGGAIGKEDPEVEVEEEEAGKIEAIKVDLLKEAGLDAKQRASSMLEATNAKVGKVKSMRMGVFQITPVDSTMVSDMGINDTTSIDKKVTAVANVVFKVK